MRPSFGVVVFGALLGGCNALFGHDPGVAQSSDAAPGPTAGDAGVDAAGPENQDSAAPIDADADSCGTACSGPDTFPACGARACPVGVLASDLPQVAALAADDTNVYWIDTAGQRVAQAPIAGGDVHVLARGQLNAGAIVSDGFSVYWSVPVAGEVRHVATSGGQVAAIATNQNGPSFVATDDSLVYWIAKGAGADNVLRARAKTGSTQSPLAVEIAVGAGTGLTVDSSSAYVTDPTLGEIERIALNPPCAPPSSCPGVISAEQPGPQLPWAHGGYVYWTNAGDQSVMRAPADGLCNQPPCEELLAKTQKTPGTIVADDTSVYWINAGSPPAYADGAVLRRDLSTGRVEEVASAQAYPIAVAITASYVVWLDRGTAPSYADGSVHRLPKL